MVSQERLEELQYDEDGKCMGGEKTMTKSRIAEA